MLWCDLMLAWWRHLIWLFRNMNLVFAIPGWFSCTCIAVSSLPFGFGVDLWDIWLVERNVPEYMSISIAMSCLYVSMEGYKLFCSCGIIPLLFLVRFLKQILEKGLNLGNFLSHLLFVYISLMFCGINCFVLLAGYNWPFVVLFLVHGWVPLLLVVFYCVLVVSYGKTKLFGIPSRWLLRGAGCSFINSCRWNGTSGLS